MVNPTVTHQKVSAKADGIDITLVLPSDWNADHNIDTVGASVYLGQTATAAGPVLELPIVNEGVGDNFSMYTKAAVDAAIVAAVAAIAPSAFTGDLFASIALTRAGCLLLNGQTIGNTGSGATFADPTAQNLFTLLWSLNGFTWPVIPARGASAAADWTALKTIAIPDARGCVIGMLDLGAGINTLLAAMATREGEQNHLLVAAEMPGHVHPGGYVPGSTTPSTGGGAVVGGVIGSNTGATGGDTAHNNVQPTMGANIFIKL